MELKLESPIHSCTSKSRVGGLGVVCGFPRSTHTHTHAHKHDHGHAYRQHSPLLLLLLHGVRVLVDLQWIGKWWRRPWTALGDDNRYTAGAGAVGGHGEWCCGCGCGCGCGRWGRQVLLLVRLRTYAIRVRHPSAPGPSSDVDPSGDRPVRAGHGRRRRQRRPRLVRISTRRSRGGVRGRFGRRTHVVRIVESRDSCRPDLIALACEEGRGKDVVEQLLKHHTHTHIFKKNNNTNARIVVVVVFVQ